MIAHALLAIIAANADAIDPPEPDGLIALTCNEVRRLLITFVIEPVRVIACLLTWSAWRRHQHRAKDQSLPTPKDRTVTS